MKVAFEQYLAKKNRIGGILRLAQEAGFPFNKYGLLKGDDDGEIDADEMFLRFAELIAAGEREEIAKFVETQCAKWQIADLYELREVADAIRARKDDK